MRKEFEQFPDLHVALYRFADAHHHVAWEGEFSGTNLGPIRTFAGEPAAATNRSIRFVTAGWTDVEDGLIVRDRWYYDQVHVLAALGLLGYIAP